MTMTINLDLSNYLLIIMCTIRNFITLSPLFAYVTACLTIMTFSFKEAIKYVRSIFILRQKMPRPHFLPGGMLALLQRKTSCNIYYGQEHLAGAGGVFTNACLLHEMLSRICVLLQNCFLDLSH